MKKNPLGWVRRRLAMGLSLQPVSRCFGFDRGVPVDRYYIARFLDAHSEDIRGEVMEVSDNVYTRRHGGDRVVTSHVLSIDPRNPDATLIADLQNPDAFQEGYLDCIICTQTLQFIFDVKAAVRSLHRMLKPGGVLLLTVPGITQVARYDMDHWGEHWRFTTMSVARLLDDQFAPNSATVASFGNVVAACAFLYGLPASDLRREELDTVDRDYELLISARAVKSGASS